MKIIDVREALKTFISESEDLDSLEITINSKALKTRKRSAIRIERTFRCCGEKKYCSKLKLAAVWGRRLQVIHIVSWKYKRIIGTAD